MDLMQFGAAGACLMDVKPLKTRLVGLFEQALRSAGAPRRLLRTEMTCCRMDEMNEA